MIDFHVHNKGKELDDFAYIIERAEALGINSILNLGDVLAYGFYPKEHQVREINDWTIKISNHFSDNIIGFMFLNPDNSTESVSDEIKRCVDVGLKGIKMEASLNTRNAKMSTAVEAAIELDLPFVQHCWNKSTGRLEQESNSSDVAFLAARYPELTLIVPHLTGIGVRGVMDLKPYKNVYIDTSGGQPQTGLVEYAVDMLGAERVLFGSDAYGFHGRDMACQLGRIIYAEISDNDKEKILFSNAKRLLKL
jgi:predicted TIM-barrel fold metal-dependent hydrolase